MTRKEQYADEIIKMLERTKVGAWASNINLNTKDRVIEVCQNCVDSWSGRKFKDHCTTPPQALEQTRWIPATERLPETDNENDINNYDVLLWVKNKTHPEREPQIYIGKLRHVDGDDGSGNFWGIETEPCEWTIWGWSYFNEPEVIAWMPLPQPYTSQESEDKE